MLSWVLNLWKYKKKCLNSLLRFTLFTCPLIAFPIPPAKSSRTINHSRKQFIESDSPDEWKEHGRFFRTFFQDFTSLSSLRFFKCFICFSSVCVFRDFSSTFFFVATLTYRRFLVSHSPFEKFIKNIFLYVNFFFWSHSRNVKKSHKQKKIISISPHFSFL